MSVRRRKIAVRVIRDHALCKKVVETPVQNGKVSRLGRHIKYVLNRYVVVL